MPQNERKNLFILQELESAKILKRDARNQCERIFEIVRRFAPYVGIVHERRTHADGADSRETRVVGGVRLWF